MQSSVHGSVGLILDEVEIVSNNTIEALCWSIQRICSSNAHSYSFVQRYRK